MSPAYKENYLTQGKEDIVISYTSTYHNKTVDVDEGIKIKEYS